MSLVSLVSSLGKHVAHGPLSANQCRAVSDAKRGNEAWKVEFTVFIILAIWGFAVAVGGFSLVVGAVAVAASIWERVSGQLGMKLRIALSLGGIIWLGVGLLIAYFVTIPVVRALMQVVDGAIS